MKYFDKILPSFFLALAMVYAISCSSTPSQQFILVPLQAKQSLVIVGDCVATFTDCLPDPNFLKQANFRKEITSEASHNKENSIIF